MTAEAEKILRDTGAILDGHFLLTSGLHSPTYVEKFKVIQYPQYTTQLCSMIARHFAGDNVQVVAGPTVGGIILAFEVARQLGVRALYAERDGERRVFRRSLTLAPGERVLVVDDILTTGGSVREVIDEVVRRRGEVIGAGILVDRTKDKIELGVPLFSCLKVSIPAYRQEECPQCQAGIPLVKPGSKPA